MAIGDAAAAAGLDIVSGTDAANTIDTEFNKVLDLIAGLKTNLPRKITVSSTAPASPQVGDVWVKVT